MVWGWVAPTGAASQHLPLWRTDTEDEAQFGVCRNVFERQPVKTPSCQAAETYFRAVLPSSGGLVVKHKDQRHIWRVFFLQ